MFFPFSVKQILRFDTRGTITSGPYVLNHIAGYMEDYGMDLYEKTDDRLSYIKGNPVRTYGRRDVLRMVVFRVEFPLNEMKITLESETILFFVIGLVAGLSVAVRQEFLSPWPFAVAAGIWMVGWTVKLLLLQHIKKELRPILAAI